MGKAKLRKKHDGLIKQARKHIGKFKEAEKRGDIGSMNYMAREMQDYMKQMEKLGLKIMPKSKRIKIKKKQ